MAVARGDAPMRGLARLRLLDLVRLRRIRDVLEPPAQNRITVIKTALVHHFK